MAVVVGEEVGRCEVGHRQSFWGVGIVATLRSTTCPGGRVKGRV
jgi:hypothetical protein